MGVLKDCKNIYTLTYEVIIYILKDEGYTMKKKKMVKLIGSVFTVIAMLFGMIFNVIPMQKVSAAGEITAQVPDGDGTQESPYKIEILGNLVWMSQNNTSKQDFSNKHFVQTKDIDISSVSSWMPIGDRSHGFSGNYDGNGHIVKGLTFRGDADVMGLFGCTSGAVITRLAVTDVKIDVSTTTYRFVAAGALIGFSGVDTISNCYSTGTVNVKGISSGCPFAGGLVGSFAGSKVSNSYSTCDVTCSQGSPSAGGFIGDCGNDQGTIVNCFATGIVSGTPNNWIGQFIGPTRASLNYCYYTGSKGVGIKEAGATENNCGQKTADFFKDQSNYSDTNYSSDYKWDFINKWKIDAAVNNGYPTLIPVVAATPISDLVITGGGNGDVKFTFSAPTGATAVELQLSKDGGKSYTPITVKGQALIAVSTTATVDEAGFKGPSAYTQYYFRLVVTGGEKAGTSNIAKFSIYKMNDQTTEQGTTVFPSCGSTTGAVSKQFNIIKPEGLDNIKIKLDNEEISENSTIDTLNKNGIWNLEIPSDIKPGTYKVEWFQLNQLSVVYDTIINFTVTAPAPTTPIINSQPASVVKNIGDTATFTVGATASDEGGLTYKWQKSTDGTTWNDTTVTSAIYTTEALAISDNGSLYRCVVTNNKNGTTAEIKTNAATLIVKPTISVQPSDVTKKLGETATLTVQAASSDGGTLSYKWQKSSDGETWTDTTVITATYTTDPLTVTDNGIQYRCVVVDSKNGTTKDAISNAVTLTVVISTSVIPSTAADEGVLTYKWQKSTDGTAWKDTTVTTATYTTDTLTASDNGSKYRCIVTNNIFGVHQDVISNAAAITVNPAASLPTISSQPTSATKNVGDTAIFTVGATAADGGTLTYKWQKSTDGEVWTNIPDATEASYTTAALTAADNGSQYRCVVTNSKNGTTEVTKTNAITITVNQSPTQPAQPQPAPTQPVQQQSNTQEKQTEQPTNAASSGVEIIVNGKVETAATAETTKEGDKTVTTLKVDDTKVEEKIKTEGTKSTVIIQAPASAGSSDKVTGTLSGQTVKAMGQKEDILEIKAGGTTYTLPAAEINIDDVAQQIGSQVALKDIQVSVSIMQPAADTVKIVEDTANKNHYQSVVKPVEFQITAKNGDKTVEVSKFNSYVGRTVAIPDGVDPSKITTGIVLNKDGSFSHVPTTILAIDGKYFAKINSLTNSTYSVIYNQKTFGDIQNHWAKDLINDMTSRLIITGLGDDKFEPDRAISRAEVATIVVKGLGLMRTGSGKDTYSDVSKSDWYYDAVSIANDYGLIKGVGNGKFDPSRNITREEAMSIINRAMTITKLNNQLTNSEAAESLNAFKDISGISSWAKNNIAACVYNKIVAGNNGNIEPKQNISRAEVAAIVQRLLVKSNLINGYASK
jgi:hypothetical protein